MHELGNKTQREDPTSFINPAFDPEFGKAKDKSIEKQETKAVVSKQNQKVNKNDDNLSHLRHSVRYAKPSQRKKLVSRSKSCPGRPIVPKMKL